MIVLSRDPFVIEFFVIATVFFIAELLVLFYVNSSTRTHTPFIHTFPDNKHVQNKANSFLCASMLPSPSKPNSVHQLRPGDINIVIALGDSISAGVGGYNNSQPGDLTNYRGLSFSIGGYFKENNAMSTTNSHVNTHFTIPNALKMYNANVKGWSSGTVERGVNLNNENSARLNMAVSGSTVDNIMEQVVHLVHELEKKPQYDLENDWKLLTLFVGGNDLCEYCQEAVKAKRTPQAYLSEIRTVLDILKMKVPKLLVNLLTIVDISQIAKTAEQLPHCMTTLNVLCQCALEKDPESLEKLKSNIRLYRSLLVDLVQSGLYDQTNDFTVVIQPFLEETVAPVEEDGITPDMSYFAPDCFHLSKKGHNYAGEALWNNMFQKVGAKSRSWFLGNKLVCPDNTNPYIYTNVNSKW